MANLKQEIISYQENYGDIPENPEERFKQLIQELNLKEKDFNNLVENIDRLKNRKWKEIGFVIYLVPKATPRPRFSIKTKKFYVFNAFDNSIMFENFIKGLNECLGIICTPMHFDLDCYMPIPNDMSKIEKVMAELQLLSPISAPDFDNVAKTYSDMMQKHLILNDSLIVKSTINKRYSRKPRIEIRIKYQEKFDCKYNKRKVTGWKYFKDLINKPDIDVA